MSAMCTANPFPVLTIGDGKNDDNRKLLKTQGTRKEAVMGTLNPEYLRYYELDAEFPEDWRLEIGIFDKGNAAFNDKLIGRTIVDLENRRHSDLLNKNM